MPRARLKTKLVLAISGMVFAIVAVLSYVYVSQLVRQRFQEALKDAEFIAREISESARDATQQNLSPALVNLDDPAQVQAALADALRHDRGLNTLLQSVVGYMPIIADVAITDHTDHAMAHNDPLQIGKKLQQREDFEKRLVDGNFFRQLQVVYGAPRTYDYNLAIQFEGHPFGNIRVGISTVFLKTQLKPQLTKALSFTLIAILVSLALSASLSNFALQPLEAIGRRLDQMTAGGSDATPEPERGRVDEYGLVNTKIDRLGRQIKDVKEVFSALKENLDQLMGTLQDGLVLFTRENRVVLVSASAERFLECSRTQLLGNVVEGVFSDSTKLGQIVLDAFALHRAIPQREIEMENGTRIQIALDFIAERGERIGALLTLRDAESVRRIEDEIELSRRLAAIGRLTSGVAHEVKNPINAIVVHLELLREKMREIDPDTRRHLDIIDNEIHRLDRVVQTLVDFNRPVELRLKTFDMRRMIEDVALLASPEAARHGVEVETSLDHNALPVNADPDLLKQAVLNVVLNGVQAMDNGGVLSIRTRLANSAAVVEVQDHGGGISPEIRDKIFNLYFTTKKQGSGIGLAMTYRVLQLHNGSLDFVSEIGQGTTFRLMLPLVGTKESTSEPAVTLT